MGYRSDVAMFVGAQTPKQFDRFLVQFKLWHLAEFGPSLKDGVFMGWDEQDYGFGADHFVFHTLDVKWYDTYPEVQRMEMLWQFIKNFINAEQQDEGGVTTFEARFVRIGEAVEDVQIEDLGWAEKWACNGISIRREILIDESDMSFGEINPMLSGEWNRVPIEEREEA